MSAYFWVRDLLSRRESGPARKLLLAPLSAASTAWGAILRLRRNLYRDRVLTSAHPGVPTFCVGNLTLGGTGKTPLVEEICRLLLDLGHRPAIVSRGYGGKRGKGTLIASEGRGLVLADPAQCGDEPYLLARHLPQVPVVVGVNRVEAARVAVERLGATCLVMDDGFQHLRLARDADIVVLDAQNPFGNGSVLPRGMLREPPQALQDADLVVLTRANGMDKTQRAALMGPYCPGVPVLAAAHQHKGLREWPEGPERDVCALSGRKILAFAGIGKPEAFFADLERLGANLVESAAFPDHHAYARADLDVLLKRARLANADLLVTTEKDAVRLTPFLPLALPLCVLGLRLGFSPEDAETLGRLVATVAGDLRKDEGACATR